METGWYLLWWGLLGDAAVDLLLHQAPSSSLEALSAGKKGRLSAWGSSTSHRNMLSPPASTSEEASEVLQSLLLSAGPRVFSDGAESRWLAAAETRCSTFSGANQGLGG